MTRALLALAAGLAVASAAPSCSISNTFADHMVLQRDSSSTLVYGMATPGDLVSLTLDGTAIKGSATDSSGIWRVAIPLTLTAAGGPHILSAVCADGSTGGTLNDVLFGDVYICSGQSNMQVRAYLFLNG